MDARTVSGVHTGTCGFCPSNPRLNVGGIAIFLDAIVESDESTACI
jgi:hypothetical protein